MPVISRDELRTRIGEVPRVLLGHLPTPMDFCGRLTEAIGGPKIYVKRDDCTGLAFGGNKTRQLEFTIAQGLAQGADVLIGGAGSQSNHSRQLAAASAKLGVGCALVLVKDHKATARRAICCWTICWARMLNWWLLKRRSCWTMPNAPYSQNLSARAESPLW